jgi:biopolymer transport protein ExbD
MARSASSSIDGGFGSGSRDIPPMSEMNTTPLIDVMLVLLIMFIITVPMQSHEVPMTLPTRPAAIEINPVRNDLAMASGGELSWNGKAISDAQLATTLGEVASYPSPPEVHFRPDPAARYERVDEVLAIAARSGVTGFGFVGNEKYAQVF